MKSIKIINAINSINTVIRSIISVVVAPNTESRTHCNSSLMVNLVHCVQNLIVNSFQGGKGDTEKQTYRSDQIESIVPPKFKGKQRQIHQPPISTTLLALPSEKRKSSMVMGAASSSFMARTCSWMAAPQSPFSWAPLKMRRTDIIAASRHTTATSAPLYPWVSCDRFATRARW